jgi:DNA polymerase-3 subunit gamma/tau
VSYLVMARKWRPLTFEDVVNQEHVKVTLVNAIKAERIAHAYLFSGPRGVGKTTIARILAKALNCEKGPTTTPCNQCSVCSEITESRSLDVLEIDGASNRGIDEVRNLRENIKYAPLKSSYKIYIIDEVHMLTDAAFNALLKTLEEPPKHVVFMFATTAPQKVPATILSRCQRFDFRRISTKDIQERLSQIAQHEEILINDEALWLLAKRADGSMRDGQSLLDQVSSFSDGDISAKTVRHLLGLVDQEIFFRLVDMISSKDVAAGLEVADSVMSEGVDLQEFFKSLTEHFRNLLVTKAAGDAPGLINIDEAGHKRLQEQAAKFCEEDLLRMIHIASDHEFNLRKSPLPRLELEMALIRLIKLDSSVTLEEILKQLENIGTASGGGFSLLPCEEKKDLNLFEESTPETTSTNHDHGNPSEKPAEPTGLENMLQHWETVIRKVKKKKMAIGTFLAGGTPIRLERDVLTVTFPQGNGFGIDMITKGKKIISQVFQEEFGRPLDLKCVIDETLQPSSAKFVSESSLKKERLAKPVLDVEQLQKKEPIIKKIVDDFDGQIIQE